MTAGSLVTLDGTASSDPDGDLLAYRWSFTQRPAGSAATLAGANAVRPTFVADRDGSYTISLVVNDGTVDSAADSVVVTAAAGNAAPVANAGPDQHVTTGSRVTLDASASSDADGDALTYAWAFSARPSGSKAVLSSATAVRPTFVADVDGAYVIDLIVSDGTTTSVPDSVTITATAGNSAPIASAGPDQNVATGALVTLDGSASHDADGDALAFAWSFTARPPGSTATLSSASAVSPTFVADLAGDYVVRLVVNDGTVDSVADIVVVTATAPNLAPIAIAGLDQSVATGALVMLDGTASYDPEHQPLTYAWSLTSKPAGSIAQLSSTTSATPTFTADVAGTYVVSLVVDDGVLASLPDATTITATTIVPGQCAIIHEGVTGQGGALLPDGRIVTVGTNGIIASELRRFANDGSGGEQLAVFYDVASGIAVEPDGHVLVTGSYTSTLSSQDLMVVRFDSDGAPDPSFGDGGTVMFDGGLAEAGAAVAAQTDGKIVVAGVSHDYDNTHGEVLLLRYNSNGTLDTSFGTGGVVIYTPGGFAFGASGLALQPDGKIVVAGTAETTGQHLFVLRFASNGTLDPSFGTGGVVTYDGGSSYGGAVALEPDGDIVVGGSSPAGMLLLRYEADGTPDASFGTAGVVSGGPGSASSVAVQPDGKLVVGGWTTEPGILYSVALVARFTANGAPDPTFAGDGAFTYDAGSAGADQVDTILLPKNGGIAAVGGANITWGWGIGGGELLLMRLYDTCP